MAGPGYSSGAPGGDETGGNAPANGGGLNYSMLQALLGSGLLGGGALSSYAMQGVSGNPLFTPPSIASLGGALTTPMANSVGGMNTLTPSGWEIGAPPPPPQMMQFQGNSLLSSPYLNSYLSMMQNAAPAASPGYYAQWIQNLNTPSPPGYGFMPQGYTYPAGTPGTNAQGQLIPGQ